MTEDQFGAEGKPAAPEATTPGTGGDDRPILDPAVLIDAAQQERARHGRFNLAIVGGTGVGKSSLVNAVFGEELAATGVGMPVTTGVNYHVNKDISLGIWDFEGFEVGSAVGPGERTRHHLQKIAEGPKEQQISVVWYCVLSTSSRLTQADIDVIRAFDREGLPVVIVLTKVARTKNQVTGKYTVSADAQRLSDWFAEPVDGRGDAIHLPIKDVVFTASVDQARFGGPAHGLTELLTLTLELSPEDTRDALRIAQRLSLPLKRELVRHVIAAATTAAAVAAASPIPVADAAALAPIQLGMMGKIATIYGLDLKIVFGAQALTQLGLQIAGKALARSFVKLIPGAGSVINASVAIALTTATGEAWRRLCEDVYTGEIRLDEAEGLWSEYAPTIIQVISMLMRGRTAPQGS